MYAAVLRRIETRELRWNSDFNRIQTQVLSRSSFSHKKFKIQEVETHLDKALGIIITPINRVIVAPELPIRFGFAGLISAKNVSIRKIHIPAH